MAPRTANPLSEEEIAEAEEQRKNAPAEDLTTFEEDDDPTKFVGELVEDEGDEKE